MSTHLIAKRLRDSKLRLLAAILSGQQSVQEVTAKDWPKLIALAHVNKLFPMLFWTIKQTAPQSATDPVAQKLREVTLANAVRHIWLERAQIQINTAFKTAGIPAIWLKGIALAATVYPQSALRPMSDIDVLVPYELRAEALKAAQALGFDFYAYPHLSGIKKPDWETGHHYHLKGIRGGVHIQLEIHYHLINEDHGMSPHKEDLWFFEQIDCSNETLPMLKPEAFLLHLCAHAMFHHGEAAATLRQFYDIHLLVSKKTINWSMVIEQAVILRWSSVVEHALTIAQYFFETSIPQDVFEQLSSRRATDEDISRSINFQGRGAKWQAVLKMLRKRKLSQKICLIREFLFPARSYLKARYHLPEWVPIWLYYPRRWISQAGTILAWVRERIGQMLQ